MGHGLSASFSLEEGWTVVRRRKEKKVVQKEVKCKEGNGTKKELCKGKNSTVICRAPSLRTGKKTPLLKGPNFVVPSSVVDPVQDPGTRGALVQEDCRQDLVFLKQVLAPDRMLRVKTSMESALSVPVVSPCKEFGRLWCW